MTEEQLQMIEDIEKRQSKCTEWEIDFIDSISNIDSLTEKQIRRLELIWERIT